MKHSVDLTGVDDYTTTTSALVRLCGLVLGKGISNKSLVVLGKIVRTV